MNAYTVYLSGLRDEGACLVFAPTVRIAKVVGHACMVGWWDGIDWTEVRANRIREPSLSWCIGHAHPQKWERRVPHAIESPPACDRCNLWGGPLSDDPDGLGGRVCEDCLTEIQS